MSTQNTSVPDSWESRIEQFAKIIGRSIQEVEAALAEEPLKLTKDETYILEMLSDENITKFGDFRSLFCDSKNVSLPKLRLGMKYLRGSKEQRETGTDTVDPDIVDLQIKYGFKTRFSDLGPDELIPYYNPEKQNRVYKALKDIFGEKPVIAFKPDSKKVAVEETVNYITDIKDGLPEEKAIEVDGELVKLYSVGRIPHEVIEEDPLFEGKPLKRGRSIVNRMNWTNISKEIRQFARIAINRNDIDPNDRINIRTLFNPSATLKTLNEIYPEAHMEYKELKLKDELPKLQLSLDDVNGSNNPFNINRKW